jgi:hypothetical protein
MTKRLDELKHDPEDPASATLQDDVLVFLASVAKFNMRAVIVLAGEPLGDNKFKVAGHVNNREHLREICYRLWRELGKRDTKATEEFRVPAKEQA